jgi:hypothetical protein
MKSLSSARVPVALSAVGEVQGRKLLLKFHLTNISPHMLSFSEWDLPWGHPNSLRFVALTVDGHAVPSPVGFWDICCDTNPTYSVSPGKSLEGTYYLNWQLPIDKVPADSDLAIIWLYPVKTGGSKRGEGMVSGVTWIHTPK